MAVPQFRDEVLVTLSTLDPPARFDFPDRRLFLTKDHPVMDIGRTSKRNSSLEASKNNGWFDSAVMSRDHAQIKFDVDHQRVYIKDTSSLHGTFKNDVRLGQGSRTVLENGDILKFGVTIDRGSDKFPPCIMKTKLEFGTANPLERTNHFSVPDETDVEDSDIEGEQDILETQERMAQALARRVSEPEAPAAAALNEQPPISYVRAKNDLTVDCPQIRPATPTISFGMGGINNRIDLTSCPSDDEPEPNSFSPISEGLDMLMGLQPHEESVPPSDGSDIVIDDEDVEGWMDDESDEYEDATPSESSSESLSPGPSPNLDPSTGSLVPIINSQGHFSLVESQDIPQAYPIISGLSRTAIQGRFNEMSGGVVVASEGQDQPDVPPQRGVSADYTVKLPSLLANTLPRPAVTLPSLAEATSREPTCIRFQETQVSGFLGEKTGKTEYFRAREVNKNQAASLQTQSPWPCLDEVAKTSLQPVPLVPRSFPGDAATHRPASPQPATEEPTTEEPTAEEPIAEEPIAEEPIAEIANAQEEEISFLDTFDISNLGGQASKVSDRVDKPTFGFHDTFLPSAFEANSAAELQKMRHEAQQNPVKQAKEIASPETQDVEMMPTQVNHDHEVVVASEAPDAPSSKPSGSRTSMKRKAADISQLPSEEEEPEPRVLFARCSSPHTPRRRKNRVRFAEPHAPRPRKRLRRVAEVVGYAALGGVAVMSALIATAPTL